MSAADSPSQTNSPISDPLPPELFLSDPHGEYQTFAQVVRGGCGFLRRQVDKAFPKVKESRRAEIVTLVCYPTEKMDLAFAGLDEEEEQVWLDRMAGWLANLQCHMAYSTGAAGADIVPVLPATRSSIAAQCRAIQQLTTKHVHIVGDVYDRGPAPDMIIEELSTHHHFDIQWGNHDIVWMGASMGQRGCIANVVRICARYGNLSMLEDNYGMDLSVLRDFAATAYADDPCVAFAVKGDGHKDEADRQANIKIQKAMAIIQFKVEAHVIDRHPSYGLESRKLLHRINYERGTIEVDGVEYEILDKVFPTIDPADPYKLTIGEEQVIVHLEQAFLGCERLRRHIGVMLDRGSLYKIVGNDLLFHACVPLNDDGTLKEVNLYGETYKGKELFDHVDRLVRAAFRGDTPRDRRHGRNLLWYLWLGAGSLLFAKSKMATLEQYLIADKSAHKEVKNAFYSLCGDPDVMAAIFKDFGMDPSKSRMICGHVPVKVKDGEDPVKGDGMVVDIDGGMSAAYQKTTGLGGMALLEDDRGSNLAYLEPFPGKAEAVKNNLDVAFTLRNLNK